MMHNFSIQHKLLLSFIGIALLSVPLNIYLMVNFNKITNNFLTVTDSQSKSMHALRAMESRRRGRVVPGSLRAGCFSAGKI